MTRTLTMLSRTAAILFVAAPITAAPLTEDAVVRQFQRRVAAYIALHERVEKPLLPLRVSSDPRDIDAAADAMADAMRAARPDAKVGDIFTPEVAVEFRRRLEEGLRAGGYNIAELLARIVEENTEGDPGADIILAVNRPLGCGFAMTPPFVFDVLPALPGELEYRFVARDLVLVDIHARLVVDILREALPEK